MKKLRLLIIACFMICFAALALACGGDELPALERPRGLKIDEATQVLTWNEVDNARGYTVSFGSEQRSTRSNSYALANLAPGEYGFVVQAYQQQDRIRSSRRRIRVRFRGNRKRFPR